MIAGALYIFALFVILQGAVDSHFLAGWPAAFAIIGALLFGWFRAVFVHELGHALAARVGWRVYIFSAGLFAVFLRPRITWLLGTRLIQDAGGFVLPVPMRPEADTRLRAIILIAAGPIVSLAAAAGAYTFGLMLEDGGDFARWCSSLLVAFSATSLGCAVLSIWPSASAYGAANDAAQILGHLRRKKCGSRPEDRGRVLAAYGFTPDAFEPWIAEAYLQAEAVRSELSAPFMEALEAEDFTRAAGMLAAPDGGDSNLMHAYLAACVEGDVDKAEQLLVTLKAADATWETGFPLRELALATIVASGEDIDAARQRLDRLEQQVADEAPVWRTLIARARRSMKEPASAETQRTA